MIRIDSRMACYPKSPLGPHVAWAHLWSDTNDVTELHNFAARLGMKRNWFQGKRWLPHYDVAGKKRHAEAIKLGAVPTSMRQWVQDNMCRIDFK